MSKGTSKRIKRISATITASGKTTPSNLKTAFTTSSFNNTQRFTEHKLTKQQYEQDLKIQQSDLIQARVNIEYLNPLIQQFNIDVDSWLDDINNAKSSKDAQVIIQSVINNWLKPHSLSETGFYELIYLFEATYYIGNQASPKKNNTADSWLNWWNTYAIDPSTSKQFVFNREDPADVSTIYWAAAMQNELAKKILANSCRVNLRDKHSPLKNVDLAPLLATDIGRTYGVAPVCPTACPAKIVPQNIKDFLIGLKLLLLFFRKCLNNLGNRGINDKTIHYIDLPVTEGVIKSDTFYVALDCEYVSRQLTNSAKNSKVRDPDDVLSFQLYAINAKGTKRNGLIVHNTTRQHFVQSELISAIQQVIEPLRFANVNNTSSRRAVVHLVGYYSGVDISCFGGWEHFWNNTNTIVLKKNAPFTLGYVTKTLNDDSTLAIDLTDLMNDAPIGGLKTVGGMVGIPKIDTEEFDAADGFSLGFYKEHMDKFRENRPDDFNAYAMNDAIITLEYALFLKKELGKIPRTLGSYAASEVSKQRQDFPNQFLADPERPLREYVQSKGSERVRPGQVDLYEEARKALYGGHNCGYVSGRGHGRIIDIDLASAYNIGGHLLPVIDYSDDDYTMIKPQELASYMKKCAFNSEVSNSFRMRDCDFELIGKQMQTTSVFLVGIGQFKIDYPDDTEFIVTPSHSKTGAPIYVKHYTDWCPLLDAYNAWLHGAKVHVNRLRVPKQSQNGLNVFGDFQNREIKLRNAAKNKMKHSKPNSPQYAQANGEQLLHKLTANSTYGKTLQGAGNRESRDFDTYLMGETPKSAVTDPLIGDNYTAFTRYLVSILYDASNHCTTKATQLNITTDGLTLVIDEAADDKKFIQQMTDYYNSQMEPFYFDRLDLAGKKRGFELKANVVDDWFNVRTRVNGNLHYSQTGEGIFATASMMGQNSDDLFQMVKDNVIYFKNSSWRISNLTEMKFRLSNHYGSQEQFEQITNVSLGYDFSYKPVELKQGPNYCYFTTLPFENREEHDLYKELGGQLVKMVPMRVNNDDFNLFLKTLNEQPLIQKKLTTLKNREANMSDYLQYCQRHFIYDVAIGVLNGDLDSEINNYCARWNCSKETIKKAVRRVINGKSKVNYVAGWYYKEELENEEF